jgi:hypothetical protein
MSQLLEKPIHRESIRMELRTTALGIRWPYQNDSLGRKTAFRRIELNLPASTGGGCILPSRGKTTTGRTDLCDPFTGTPSRLPAKALTTRHIDKRERKIIIRPELPGRLSLCALHMLRGASRTTSCQRSKTLEEKCLSFLSSPRVCARAPQQD